MHVLGGDKIYLRIDIIEFYRLNSASVLFYMKYLPEDLIHN